MATKTKIRDTAAPSREEFIDRARAMVGALRERAPAAEANRIIPDQTHHEFRDAGLYRLLQPRRYGGYEMDPGLVVDIAAELGRGCGSSAWIFTNLVMHGLTNGMKDPRAHEDVWGDNPDALIASSYPAKGARVELVDGGIVVDGTWSYSSGVDFADWNHLQIFLSPEDGAPEHRFALVAKSDYQVVDDWFVNGLTATGSRSIVLKDVFIPDYRMLSSLAVRGGPTPGSAASPGVLYQLPYWGIGAKWFSAPAIGIARGALEITEDDIASRSGVGGAKLWEQPTVHLKLAESGAEAEAAWALLKRDCADVWRLTEAGGQATILQRARWRRNNSYAAVLSVRAVERLFGLAGMRGMAPDSAIQRAWRDVHAVVCQVGVAWDTQALNYGRARFDLPIGDPRV